MVLVNSKFECNFALKIVCYIKLFNKEKKRVVPRAVNSCNSEDNLAPKNLFLEVSTDLQSDIDSDFIGIQIQTSTWIDFDPILPLEQSQI